MACTFVRDGNGLGMMVCGSRQPQRPCKFCGGGGKVEKLCDFPIGAKKTCDAGMCAKCATSVGPDRDFCPKHKGMQPAQTNLFGEGV
jgi:hypothetical protein